MPINALNLKSRIKCLKAVLADAALQQIVENELHAANGDWSIASATLKDKLSQESLQRLHIADSVATAIGDSPKVVAAILKDVGTLRDVARLNVESLIKLIAPNAKPNTKAYKQAKIQATAINNQSFAREPLTVLQRMTHDRELPIANTKVCAGLSTFLQRIPVGTNIRTTPIHKFLTDDALNDVPEEHLAEIVVHAKALWRSMTISPPDAPNVPPVLMKAHLTSAFHVGEMPESTFLRRFSEPMGGVDTARQVYTNAINARIRNEHALITMREAVRGTGLAAIDGQHKKETRMQWLKDTADKNDVPLNLDALFGDMDYCECKQCQSVYSASAYFVELLNFLRNNNLSLDPATGTDATLNPNIHLGIPGTPLEKLFRRRPDLGDLELSCENTNTVLPYIDLVNEVMESFVVHRADYAADKHDPKQTTLDVFNVTDETKDELLAQPQHTNYSAYCILKNVAVYPFTLPFHQPIESARIFLKYLGTSRYEVLDSFRAAHESVGLRKSARFTDTSECGNERELPPNYLNEQILEAHKAAINQKQDLRLFSDNDQPIDRTLPFPETEKDPTIRERVLEERKLQKLHENVVLNRAIEAEFLGLTQEEYTILTKGSFWPKEYFNITQKTTFTDEQYQHNIGVKPPHEYYGYATELAMLDNNEDPTIGQTGLSFVKMQFLRRTGIQYTDLVKLLKTRFINPRYPKGLALTILENIRSSYRFLQTLVDVSSTDPKIRFAKLIDFLEKNQSWISRLQVAETGTFDASYIHVESKENPIIREWVYSCFEQLGKLIVLESQEGQQLPIAGMLYINKENVYNSFAKLRSDGTIFNPSNGVLVGTVSVDIANDLHGHPTVYAGPVNWARPGYGADNINIKDENGNIIGRIDPFGLWTREGDERAIRVKWKAPIDTCTLDKVRLLHLDGSAVTPEEFDRMQRFIRLWRKLGWSIDEVDKALTGLVKKSVWADESVRDTSPLHINFNAFKDTCCPSKDWSPRYGSKMGDENVTCDITPEFLHQLVSVKKLLEQTGLPLIKLLSFWADVSTAGEKSLYSSLFLTHNLVGIDNVFIADVNGNYLTGSEKITNHLPVLMAALKLKADDITTIIGSPNALLTLQNVSLIYRYGLLAKALHIKVSDLVDLKGLFDEPFTDADKTLKLFDTWEKMEDAGFTFRQLTYIIKNRDDAQKPLSPSQKTILQIAKTLYDGLNAIDHDNQYVADVEQATTELLRTKAGLLFEPLVVENILGLLEGTTVYTTNAPAKLAITIPDSLTKKLVYRNQKDTCPQKASIQVTGLLTDDEQKLAKSLSVDPKWPDAVDRVHKQAVSFFNNALADILPDQATDEDNKNNRLHPLAGDVIVVPQPDQTDPSLLDQNTAPKKRLYFLHYYLPKLYQRLEQRFISDTISATVGLTTDVTNVLLSEVISAGTPSLSAMEALRSIMEKPATVSGWKGYLIPPADGSYAFVASVSDQDPDTPPAPLTIEGFNELLKFVHQQEDPTNVWSTDQLPLKAGKLYFLTITDQDAAQLQWRTTASPATQIPTSALLPDFTNQSTKDVFIKLCKAAIMVKGFNLSADEVRYFQTPGADSDNFYLNSVTLDRWQRIADYSALRNSLPKAGMPLLDLFEWASKPDNATKLVEKLNDVTQWGKDRITALIADNHFDLNCTDAFRNEKNLVKMQKAIAVADKVGVDIDRLFNWAVPGSKFWTCHKIAEDIRLAMRARFDAEDWEQAVKPLSDQLREMQKEAMISYLLVQPDLINWGVVDADSLFEFFLIDVQMGSARQTSRMVQAIASVQLFIKRCLMGLEEKLDRDGKQITDTNCNPIGVSSADIDRDRWEWMQKYRIWEANRKVYLYPENWIRPELRDDKSPFYKELESELLQKDINTQTVEEALKNYLYKVDEVANLQVVGLFQQPALDITTGAPAVGNGNVNYVKLHVFARTRNAPYFFFYRYYSINEGYWYPWERIQVDFPSYDVEKKDANGNNTGKTILNGTFLIPVVWNNRLLVFFPQFMKKTIAASDKSIRNMAESTLDNLKPTEMWEIKMAWSEYRKRKWTQKQVSSDAIYNMITPSAQIYSYVFIPSIATNPSKVAIDIYHEKAVAPKPEPTPEPISLVKAELFTYRGITKGIDVKVTSLIDGSEIASWEYKKTNSHQYVTTDVFDLDCGLKPPLGVLLTKDQCQSFRVDIILSKDAENPVVLNFDARVVLSFSDSTDTVLMAPPNKVKPIFLQRVFPLIPSMPPILTAQFCHIEPDGPTLDSVKLHIETHNGDGQNKNVETTFHVAISDLNGEKFAELNGGGKNNEYIEGSSKDIEVPVTKKAITKAECQNFKVKMTQYTGHDTWGFDATVTLNFQDGSSTKATKSLKLENNEASDSFTSSDTYTPTIKTIDQQPDNSTIIPIDDSITQRFEFLGNKFSVVDIPADDPVQQLDLQGYCFHYQDLEEWKRIHSLQVEYGTAPSLINKEPYFDDTQTRFEDKDTRLAITDKQLDTFSYLGINNLLSKLNTDQIGNLFKYYLALYDIKDPTKAEMADVYGAYDNDKGQASYHELKRPNSIYNWEVCFHAPMQLVEHLLKSQHFDQALAICHYVFNPLAKPTDGEEITMRCWQFPPFKEIDAKKVLETLFNDLEPGKPDNKINEWRDKPFQPHVVARKRPSAYMKYVVMKYIEILIAYGDYYFRQNTMESIPLAIQCFVMASHLYGPRGQKIPRRGKIVKQTYNSLLDKWDAFGNAMVELELAFPCSNQISSHVGNIRGDVALPNIFGFASTLYFGIPDNPNLTALRDTIDDRLFKIRHCEDIEGVFRQLPLFEPPIDPALLVQAAGQGLSLSSVLNDMNSPMPNYRFYYLLQKALELCGELKTLSNAFLSTKEKRNAEALSNMRAKHESGIHTLVMEVKKQQLEEATKSLEALLQSRKSPVSRMQYYLQLIGEDLSKVPDDSVDFSDLPNQMEQPVDESGLKLIHYEKEEMDKASDAADWQVGIGVVETLGSILHVLPELATDIKPWGIGAGITLGGTNLGNASQAVARGLQVYASYLTFQSTSAGRKGGFLRQLQDRIQQANAAGYEIKNIDKQILTQQIRIAITNQEITNQQKQIDNAQEVEEFLRNKYANEELYSWMEGEIRTIYHQAYNLAYDLAKKAEKAYWFERGLSKSNFIQYGYWDAGRDGLLAGERLYLALKQLESAYQEKRGYDYEITKYVSLRQVNPIALLQLRESGQCEIALPEVLFDMDHPGHYMRRIKSVTLTIPCVVGPYTSLNCTLRLLEHKFRTNSIANNKDSYPEKMDETDDRFSTVNIPITSIAVSTGQNDSGVFELNFRDERYIPFEGAGVISKWRIELPEKFRQFDYDSISDVVMQLRYTAVNGGDKLKKPAADSMLEYIKSAEQLSRQEGLFAAFDLKHDFPNEWYKATQSTAGATDWLMTLNNLSERLPFFTKGRPPANILATDIYLFTSAPLSASSFELTQATDKLTFKGGPPVGTMKSFVVEEISNYPINSWQLKIQDGNIKLDKLWLLVRYVLK